MKNTENNSSIMVVYVQCMFVYVCLIAPDFTPFSFAWVYKQSTQWIMRLLQPQQTTEQSLLSFNIVCVCVCTPVCTVVCVCYLFSQYSW